MSSADVSGRTSGVCLGGTRLNLSGETGHEGGQLELGRVRALPLGACSVRIHPDRTMI